MSTSSSNLSPRPAADITSITEEPIVPQPLIAEILRTRYCIPGSVFLVERVDYLQTSQSKRWRAVRLLLGDGELCIQALLSAEMHRYVDGGEVYAGSYIKLMAFRVMWVNEQAQQSVKDEGTHVTAPDQGRMVYLVVEGLMVMGWDNRLLKMLDLEDDALSVESTKISSNEPQDDQAGSTAKGVRQPKSTARVPEIGLLEEIADADDDFETMTVPEQKATQERAEIAEQTAPSLYAGSMQSTHLPWSATDPTRPFKLTPLRSIPNLPYKQNWSTNILAVVSAITDLQPSMLPPFNQRQARLADPSTSKHVHLTIFLDPEEFAPKVGSVVLLIGVKNHRFDGGSLKKYASDRPKDDATRWWYENPTQFSWCDVEGLRRWWDGRKTRNSEKME